MKPSLYDSLARAKKTLPDQKKIRLFVCGPTVYDYLHIGNARTYIFFDFFAKYLRARGYDVTYVQNITNIDDKIIARAAKEHVAPAELATRFTDIYFENMTALDVAAVTQYAKATDFISQIIAQVERLIDKGYAYKIDGDGWYFDIAKDADYGALSGRTAEQAEDGVSRIDESIHKKNRGDFCLWKFSDDVSDEKNEPSWPSALGAGRPGWHIEDTAISEFYFGPQYEIHGGGVDLKFPHHEAEIAQQESASGKKPFVQIWMHVGALTLDGKKMSKSVGNVITIDDFLARYPATVLRWMVLSHDYRSPVDYSERVIAQTINELENLYMLARAAREEEKKCHDYKNNAAHDGTCTNDDATRAEKEKLFAVLDDDLNTPKACAIFFEILKDKNLSACIKCSLVTIFDELFGLNIAQAIGNDAAIPPEIAEKFAEYKESRSNKQFIQSDALRKEVEALGYVIRDSAEGSDIIKKFF